MIVHSLTREQRLPIDRETAWEFFSSPRNLDSIMPPDMGFQITNDPSPEMHEGQIVTYRVGVFPGVKIRWVTEIKSVEEGRSFIDEQRFGPYKFWHHRHTFEEIPGGTLIGDKVNYALGFGPFGSLAHGIFVRKKLESIFRYRHEMLEKRFGKL